jgi:predicted RNase H-like HicB family nuclease
LKGIIMKNFTKRAEDYLKDAYSRILVPDKESGTYTAEILEFHGCIAQGDTPSEAYQNLEEAARGWIEAALDLNQNIPAPAQAISYGGKVLIRMPKSLHRHVSLVAEREGVSLNQFVVSTIAEKVGAYSFAERLTKRLDQHIVNIATHVANTVVANINTVTISSVVGLNASVSNFINAREVTGYAGDKQYCILTQGSGGGIN